MRSLKDKRIDSLPSLDTRSCIDLPSLPTAQKLKSSTSRVFGRLLSTSQNISKSNLAKLQKRKKPSMEVTPNIVRNVLKSFFIPIFEAQRHRQMNLKTQRTAEYRQSLSESLRKELKKSHSKLEELDKNLRFIESDRERKKQEIEEYKLKILNFQSFCKASRVQQSEVRSLNKAQSCSLAGDYSVIHFENIETKNLLAYERERNLLLQDKALVLEHWNSLYNMQSDIMGEQLKGVYFCCNDLSQEDLHKTLVSHQNDYKFYCVKLENIENKKIINIQDTLKSITNAIDESFYTLKIRKSLIKEIKDKTNSIKYENEWLSIEYRKKSEEKHLFFDKFLELEKKNNVLEEEYAKLRKLIENIKVKSKLNDYEEKVCRFCRKVFFEKDNFNWSCRNHVSDWGENLNYYWCCGAVDKETPGCQLSKHVSDEGSENLRDNRKAKIKVKCVNCGEIGHLVKDCGKDPNPKTSEGFKTRGAVKHRKKKSINALGMVVFEDSEEEFEYFDDIDLTKREAVLEEFNFPGNNRE